MKKALTILLAAFTIYGSLSAAGKVDFSGNIQTIWGAGAPWTNKDSSAGRLLLGNTSFNGKLDAYYNDSSALADATVSYEAVTNSLSFSINELWLDYTSSFWGIRIGRQKAAWGKADGVDITNVICPKDMSSFAAMTSDDSKLPIDSIRLSFTGNQFTADLYWIPFFTPTALPLNDGNPLKKFIVPATVSFPIQGLSQPLTVPVTLGTITKPEVAIWNGEYGLKLSGYFSALDVSLYGFYGWDDTPQMNNVVSFAAATSSIPFVHPESVTVNGEYKRMSMIGLDGALPIKEIVIRLEAAFFPQRYFSLTEQRNEISALAGLDWMPSGWTITAQYFCDFVFGDISTLKREKAYTHGATLSVSKSFLNETLDVSVSGLININDLDSFISPSVNYSLSDQINLEAGAYIFLPGPEREGEYGKYKDLSTIYIKGKFSF